MRIQGGEEYKGKRNFTMGFEGVKDTRGSRIQGGGEIQWEGGYKGEEGYTGEGKYNV